MGKFLTTSEFISRAEKTHENKYDYSKVSYKDYHSKVCIICPKHGEFLQTPERHLLGYGCQKCSVESRVQKRTFTKEEFISRAQQVHNGKYDYTKVEYVNSNTKVCIICPIHGESYQIPSNHLRSCGCQKMLSRQTQETRMWCWRERYILLSKTNISKMDIYD